MVLKCQSAHFTLGHPREFVNKQIPAGVSSFRHFIKIAGKTPVVFFFKTQGKAMKRL